MRLGRLGEHRKRGGIEEPLDLLPPFTSGRVTQKGEQDPLYVLKRGHSAETGNRHVSPPSRGGPDIRPIQFDPRVCDVISGFPGEADHEFGPIALFTEQPVEDE